MVSFGEVREGSSPIKTVEIFATEDKTFKITDIKCGPSIEIVKLETIEEGKKYHLDIKLKPHKFTKILQDYVNVYTDYPKLKQINIKVYANIVSPISVVPEEIVLSNTIDIPVTRYILINVVDNISFKIESIEVPIPSIKVEVFPIDKNDYRIKLSNVQPSNILNGKTIKILTNIPEKKEITVPFRIIE
ncbi:MAG: hypothetical protein NC827_03120 [Candidatus Omnitrophica bacterium]|nr:hypothetical protein [Candidatus Omnitrophota bacterium]MCM8802284.1 hypothetical protein [Candidatus Omnitrophota bacterium]